MERMIFLLQPVKKPEELKGTFYVIENFHTPQLVTDENGNIKSFAVYEDAQNEADQCQQGNVICI